MEQFESAAARNDLVRAVADLVRDGDHERAVSLIEADWDALATTQPALMLAAIGELPASALLARRHLYLAATELQSLTHNLGVTASPSPEPGTASGSIIDRITVLTANALYRQANGDDARATQLVTQARRLVDRVAGAELLHLHRRLPYLKMQWALCSSESERVTELEDAYDLAVPTGQSVLARRAAGELAWAYASSGWSSDADLWIDRALGLPPGHPRHEEPLILARALRAADALDDVAARAIVAQVAGTHRAFRGAALWVRALCAGSALEAAVVEAALASGPDHVPGRGRAALADHAYQTTARVELAFGWRPDAIRSLAEHADRLDGVIGAAVLSRASQPERALAMLRTINWDALAPRRRATALLSMSAALLIRGETDRASETFTRAYAVIQDGRLLRAYGILTTSSLQMLCQLSGLHPDPRIAEPGATIDVSQLLTPLAGLTRRQRQVLALLGAEYRVSQIAAELFVSTNTVKTTMRHLYARLGVHSRAEAVRIAQQIGVA